MDRRKKLGRIHSGDCRKWPTEIPPCPPLIKGGGGDVVGRFFFLLVSFLLFSAQDSFSATFTDEIGRQVEVKAPPQRIISVAPSVTETPFALGLGEKVVGVSSHCNYPPAALKKEKGGGS